MLLKSKYFSGQAETRHYFDFAQDMQEEILKLQLSQNNFESFKYL